MSLVHYQPWSTLRNFQRDVDHLIGHQDAARDLWVPAVDILELADRFELVIDVPGVDPSKLQITSENGELAICGERGAEPLDDVKLRRIERARGSFNRRFQMPDTADIENIEANANNGVLTISVPKKAQLQPRRIDIKVS